MYACDHTDGNDRSDCLDCPLAMIVWIAYIKLMPARIHAPITCTHSAHRLRARTHAPNTCTHSAHRLRARTHAPITCTHSAHRLRARTHAPITCTHSAHRLRARTHAPITCTHSAHRLHCRRGLRIAAWHCRRPTRIARATRLPRKTAAATGTCFLKHVRALRPFFAGRALRSAPAHVASSCISSRDVARGPRTRTNP